jgi:sensor c-di-GMP phosphodiesterase-like protein
MATLNYWQHRVVDQLGREQVEDAASRMIGLAEHRIDSVLSTLDGLLEQGVEDCRGGQIEALRRAAFSNPWVKEIAAVGADGRIRCASRSAPIGPRMRLSSGGEQGDVAGAAAPPIDIVRIGQSETMLRVTRRGGDGALTALIPAALLSPYVSPNGNAAGGFARMTASDGTVIVQSGTEPAGAAGAGRFHTTRRSDRLGLTATASLPRSEVQVEAEHGRTLAVVIGAIAMVLVFAFISQMPRRRSDPISDFEQALAANEFVPYYQPVVDIRTGRLRGAEVLVRWRKSDGSLVVPSAFIPLAESSGLIVPMTRALMRRACEDTADALANRPDIKIGFNLAALHFVDDTIVGDIREIFGRSAIRMRQVVLEVTERQPLENLAAARRVIAGLQELGCGVAIDDVGTGHGGLSYMLKLGADTIKIDKMFIDGIGTEHHSTKIIESLVDLARNMRMDVIAEGVESFEQVMKLRELGILAAQGHVFCPPIPASSFIQLVEAIAPPADGKGTHDDIEAFDVGGGVLGVAAA